jgi:hypothetical protein
MNFQAAVKGIAPAGGIRPASHITASFVSATKAKPAAHYFVGQRSKTDERLGLGIPVGATSRSGGGKGLWPATALKQTSPHYRRNLGNPCAEKVRPHRARQNNVSEPALVAGVGDHWQGTLTITGSNVRLGTEMPVALSLF